MLYLLACVANTLMDADHDEHGLSLVLNATKFGPDQPEIENSRLLMKSWCRLVPTSKSKLKTMISYLKSPLRLLPEKVFANPFS